MRIMIDTNVLLSSLVFQSKKLTTLIEKVAEEHTMVLCSFVIDELYSVIRRKAPEYEEVIDKFLSKLSFEYVFSAKPIEKEKLFEIRDENDYIILHTAIIEGIDILITGDKDFRDINIEKPKILTPAEFIERYIK